MPNRFEELIPILFNPEIHRIAAHETKPAHLPVDVVLQRWLNVAQKQVILGCIRARKFRLEAGEYIQVRPECGAIVHIRGVDARPKECFAWNLLESFEIDTFV